jgi:hypothetical protein
MTDEEITDEIAVAAGYGLTALSLQSAMAAQLALRGVFSPQQLVAIAETAEQVAGAGVIDASGGAVLIAQAAIRGLAQTWQKPDKQN